MAGSGADGKDDGLGLGINVSVVREHAKAYKSAHGGVLIVEGDVGIRGDEMKITRAVSRHRPRERLRCEQMLLIVSSKRGSGEGHLLGHR